MNTDLSSLDGLGMAELVARKEVSAAQLVTLATEQIERLNPKLNAVISVLHDEAQAAVRAGLPDGPFTGVPFLVKEIILHAAGIPFNMGSRFARGFVLPHDTELMKRFRRAGFVTIGTTQLPEFALNITTEPVLFGPARNPWDPTRTTGGSSGGAGAVVAAGIVPIAHANDAAGSIRIPASCCGLFGLKPTRGRVPMGPDLGDALGGLGVEFAVTRSVRDAAVLLDAVAGPDPGAPHYPPPPEKSFQASSRRPPGRLRLAWTTKPDSGAPVDAACIEAVHDAVKLLDSLGHELVEEAPPPVPWEPLLDTLIVIWAASITQLIDLCAALTGRTPSPDNLETATWKILELGRTLPAMRWLDAMAFCNRICRTTGPFFSKFDGLITPTLAREPIRIGECNQNGDWPDLMSYFRHAFNFAAFTPVANITGQPAMSIPLSLSPDGLPVGVQVTGRFGDESTLLSLAAQLEEARPWTNRRPPIHAGAAATP